MRSAWVACALVAALGWGTPAGAKQKTFQNDDFVANPGTGVTSGEIGIGEGYASRFFPDVADFPLKLLKLQVLAVDNTATMGNECGSFSVRVFAEQEVAQDAPAMPPVYDSSTADTTWDVAANAMAMTEIDLSSYNIGVASGAFRVELHAEEPTCAFAQGNGKFPVAYVDEAIQVGRNYVYGNPGTGQFGWYDAALLGVSGDFVLRVVAEVPGTVQPDVVEVVPDLPPEVSEPMDYPEEVEAVGEAVPEAGPDQLPEWGEPMDYPEVVEATPEVAQDVTADLGGSEGAAPGLRVDQVVPSSGSNDKDTDILVMGAGFLPGATVRLDASYVIVKGVDSNTIEATVTKGLEPGTKTLVVQNPDGTLATLADAFEVRAVQVGEASSSCTLASRPSPASLLALALLLTGLARSRRRSRA